MNNRNQRMKTKILYLDKDDTEKVAPPDPGAVGYDTFIAANFELFPNAKNIFFDILNTDLDPVSNPVTVRAWILRNVDEDDIVTLGYNFYVTKLESESPQSATSWVSYIIEDCNADGIYIEVVSGSCSAMVSASYLV